MWNQSRTLFWRTRSLRVSLGTNIKALSVHLTYMKHSSVLEYSRLKLERPNKKSAGSSGVGFSSAQVCQVSHINHSPLPGLWNTDVSPSNLSQNIRPLWKQGNSYPTLPTSPPPTAFNYSREEGGIVGPGQAWAHIRHHAHDAADSNTKAKVYREPS